MARPTPIRPEIHEYGNGNILNDFIEQRVVGREGFGNGRQGRFTFSATTSAGKMFRWNAVLLSAVAAGTNDRHTGPPLNVTNAEQWMRGGSQKARGDPANTGSTRATAYSNRQSTTTEATVGRVPTKRSAGP